MNLPTAYSEAIKYAAAPYEGIYNFSKQSQELGSLDTGGSHPDRIFADWLQDHDDPRHQIIRKDLAFREHPNGFLHGITASGIHHLGLEGNERREISGPYPIESPYHNLAAARVYHGNKSYYSVQWNSPFVTYRAHFSPEEFQDFLKELESPQTLEHFE